MKLLSSLKSPTGLSRKQESAGYCSRIVCDLCVCLDFSRISLELAASIVNVVPLLDPF